MRTMRVVDEPWPLRIMAAAMLLATYFFSIRPLIDARMDVDRQTEEISMRTKIAERTIRNADTNLSLAKTIRRELGDVRLDVDENTALAAFLVDVDGAAQRRGVQVLEIQPIDKATSGMAAAKNEAIVGMHVRGRYGDVLHFSGDLSMLRSLVSIRSLSLVRDAHTVHAGAAPDLDAMIKIAIIRSADSAAPSSATDLPDHPKGTS